MKQTKIETPQAKLPEGRLRPKKPQTEKLMELEQVEVDKKQGGLFDGKED